MASYPVTLVRENPCNFLPWYRSWYRYRGTDPGTDTPVPVPVFSLLRLMPGSVWHQDQACGTRVRT